MRKDKYGEKAPDEQCAYFMRLNLAQNSRIILLRQMIRQFEPEKRNTDELNKH